MIDIRMWGRALGQMPKLSAEQWRNLDPFARWLIACRAPVLFMTLTAAALGGLLAWRADSFDLLLWVLSACGLLMAHATNNLVNDYTDSKRGIDRGNYYRNQYGVHVIEDGLMSQREFWLYLGFTGLVAISLGLLVVAQRGGETLNLMLAGSFFVLFYTWPLKYLSLGEPAVLLVWGPLMVGGTFYVVAGYWDWSVAWLSLVFALGPTTVLFGKHTDKLEADRSKGVNTMPVVLGEARARAATLVMLVLQYALCCALVLYGYFGWPLLLVLLYAGSLRRLFSVLGKPKPQTPPENYPAGIWPLWFSAHAFQHTRYFTTLFLTGVIIDTLLR